MIKTKRIIKKLVGKVETIFFKSRKRNSFLKYYPKGRNHIYDVINYYRDNPKINIIDVGANVGDTAMDYNIYFKLSSVYCFEPVTKTFNQLCERIKNKSNISCFNYALGDKANEVRIKINPTSSGLNSLIEKVNEDLSTKENETVKVRTLDEFVLENQIKSIGILKIDTEGYETHVLNGAKICIENKIIDFIFCEVGFRGEPHKGQFSKINEFLWSKGYIFSGLYDEFRIGPANTYIQFSNALFSKYSPVS